MEDDESAQSAHTFSSQYCRTLGEIKRSAGMQLGQPLKLSKSLSMPALICDDFKLAEKIGKPLLEPFCRAACLRSFES